MKRANPYYHPNDEREFGKPGDLGFGSGVSDFYCTHDVQKKKDGNKLGKRKRIHMGKLKLKQRRHSAIDIVQSPSIEDIAVSKMEYKYLVDVHKIHEIEVVLSQSISIANNIFKAQRILKQNYNKDIDYLFVTYKENHMIKAEFQGYLIECADERRTSNKYFTLYGIKIVPYRDSVDMLSEMKRILISSPESFFAVFKDIPHNMADLGVPSAAPTSHS